MLTEQLLNVDQGQESAIPPKIKIEEESKLGGAKDRLREIMGMIAVISARIAEIHNRISRAILFGGEVSDHSRVEYFKLIREYEDLKNQRASLMDGVSFDPGNFEGFTTVVSAKPDGKVVSAQAKITPDHDGRRVERGSSRFLSSMSGVLLFSVMLSSACALPSWAPEGGAQPALASPPELSVKPALQPTPKVEAMPTVVQRASAVSAEVMQFDIKAFRFSNPDEFFQNEVGDDRVSSLRGWGQGEIAKYMFGIKNFNPNNKEDMDQFIKQWGDPGYESKNPDNNRQLEALLQFVRAETLARVQGDSPFDDKNPDWLRHGVSPEFQHTDGNQDKLTVFYAPGKMKEFLAAI